MTEEEKARWQYVNTVQYWEELEEYFNQHYGEICEENRNDYGEVSGDVGGA